MYQSERTRPAGRESHLVGTVAHEVRSRRSAAHSSRSGQGACLQA